MLTFLTIGHVYGTPAGDDLYETEIPDAHTRIQEIANVFFQGGFVFASGIGFWEGSREYATCIMLADTSKGLIIRFCNAIKAELYQDAIGCFEIESKNTFV